MCDLSQLASQNGIVTRELGLKSAPAKVFGIGFC